MPGSCAVAALPLLEEVSSNVYSILLLVQAVVHDEETRERASVLQYDHLSKPGVFSRQNSVVARCFCVRRLPIATTFDSGTKLLEERWSREVAVLHDHARLEWHEKHGQVCGASCTQTVRVLVSLLAAVREVHASTVQTAMRLLLVERVTGDGVNVAQVCSVKQEVLPSGWPLWGQQRLQLFGTELSGCITGFVFLLLRGMLWNCSWRLVAVVVAVESCVCTVQLARLLLVKLDLIVSRPRLVAGLTLVYGLHLDSLMTQSARIAAESLSVQPRLAHHALNLPVQRVVLWKQSQVFRARQLVSQLFDFALRQRRRSVEGEAVEEARAQAVGSGVDDVAGAIGKQREHEGDRQNEVHTQHYDANADVTLLCKHSAQRDEQVREEEDDEDGADGEHRPRLRRHAEAVAPCLLFRSVAARCCVVGWWRQRCLYVHSWILLCGIHVSEFMNSLKLNWLCVYPDFPRRICCFSFLNAKQFIRAV